MELIGIGYSNLGTIPHGREWHDDAMRYGSHSSGPQKRQPTKGQGLHASKPMISMGTFECFALVQKNCMCYSWIFILNWLHNWRDRVERNTIFLVPFLFKEIQQPDQCGCGGGPCRYSTGMMLVKISFIRQERLGDMMRLRIQQMASQRGLAETCWNSTCTSSWLANSLLRHLENYMMKNDRSYGASLGMMMSLKPVVNQMMLTRLRPAHHKWTWSFLHWLLCTPWLKILINQNMLCTGGTQPESLMLSSPRLVNVDVGFPRTSWSRSARVSGPFQKPVRMLCYGAFSQNKDHLGELGVLKDPTTSDGKCFL